MQRICHLNVLLSLLAPLQMCVSSFAQPSLALFVERFTFRQTVGSESSHCYSAGTNQQCFSLSERQPVGTCCAYNSCCCHICPVQKNASRDGRVAAVKKPLAQPRRFALKTSRRASRVDDVAAIVKNATTKKVIPLGAQKKILPMKNICKPKAHPSKKSTSMKPAKNRAPLSASLSRKHRRKLKLQRCSSSVAPPAGFTHARYSNSVLRSLVPKFVVFCMTKSALKAGLRIDYLSQ